MAKTVTNNNINASGKTSKVKPAKNVGKSVTKKANIQMPKPKNPRGAVVTKSLFGS